MKASLLPPLPPVLPHLSVSSTALPNAAHATLIRQLSDINSAPALINGVRPSPSAGDVRFSVNSDHTNSDGANSTSGVRWLVGLGDGTPNHFRTAGAALIRAHGEYLREERDAGGQASEVVQIHLDDRDNLGDEVVPREFAQLALGLLLGGYRYQVSKNAAVVDLLAVHFVVADSQVSAYREVLADIEIQAAATALTRDLANTPSNIKDPAWLAAAAERVASETAGLQVRVRDESWLESHGFGGVLAVGNGSAKPPRLIELSYRPRQASKHLLFVGKGITFDTGGLSIKPAANMHLMRTDMAGGAAVIAAIHAIAKLRLGVRVTALIPAAENHVSGSAYRPGDVVRHYGGTTTEVSNTDAEGRMVLADALAYGIRRFEPDVVVDVATLTGAMKIALGLRTGGLFSNEDDLAQRTLSAGERAGEQWWRMPLLEAHAEGVRSQLADLRQDPTGPGGIGAALFLREFTEKLPWAHLDIAGPARAENAYAEVTPGGTGFAARTLIELATSYS